MPSGRRRAPVSPPKAVGPRHQLAIGLTALAVIAGLSLPSNEPAMASTLAFGDASLPGQSLAVDGNVVVPTIERDAPSATDGVETLSSNGTNADWAKLVLMFGGWPQTDENVAVMLRWMRQENGPPDWWNRNNPLNNGYGSGGGAGLGNYPDLVTAARYAAANLHRGYPGIVAGLAAGTSADATAQAIWASPWASSHYGNGSHWSTRPVEIVKAPASAWG
jgi:hypothetical protein